jgi:hypothetical protein
MDGDAARTTYFRAPFLFFSLSLFTCHFVGFVFGTFLAGLCYKNDHVPEDGHLLERCGLQSLRN